jgi:DNA-binding transcriptional LysR family regulator
MELSHLRYFTTVAELLHFGKAAKKLNISQPPLSQQIRKLEDELQIKLFVRTSRKVELTEAGKTFYAEAKAILNRAETATEKMKEIASGSSGSLAIGFNEAALNTALPSAIKKFRTNYPGVKLQLKELETPEQLSAIRENKIQLGILRLFHHDISGLKSKLILKEVYKLAVPNGHHLSKSKKIPLKKLNGESIIIFPQTMQPDLHKRILDTCAKQGAKLNIAQEAASKQTTLALVESGIGCAFVPASSEKNCSRKVDFLELAGDLPDVEISAVWKESAENTALAAFTRFLENRNASVAFPGLK